MLKLLEPQGAFVTLELLSVSKRLCIQFPNLKNTHTVP